MSETKLYYTYDIKQLASINAGWTFCYVSDIDGKLELTYLPITGQALVASYSQPLHDPEAEREEFETRLDFVVFSDYHGNSLVSVAELTHELNDELTENAYSVGVCEPGKTFGMGDFEVKYAVQRLTEKMEREAEKVQTLKEVPHVSR